MSEILGETDEFIEQVQHQFDNDGIWDMPALEIGLREALLKDGCHILEALLNQPNSLGSNAPDAKPHDNRSRRVQSLLGSFELSRGYYNTKSGRIFPMDKILGLTDSYSPGLAKMMCLAAGTDGSYDEAETTLRIYAGVVVPASQIKKMVSQIGPDIGQWTRTRKESRCEKVSTLYATYDGTGVPMRETETQGRKGKQPDGSSKTREVKLGSVFTSQSFDKDGIPVRDNDSTTYVAGFEKAVEFGSRIRQEARLRGMDIAERICILGDGAPWIWNIARINFPDGKQILDFYHACEHLTRLATAFFPSNNSKVLEFVDKWKKLLENDKVLKIVAEASNLLPHHGPRRKTALCEMGYFKKNAERMMYHSFRKEGYFIGSGVIEAGCKSVIGKRTKQSGMFWKVTGAQNILDVRCSIVSETYDQYWTNRRFQQLNQLKLAA